MAYSREQLMTALRNADAAGDTEGARRIAQMLSSGDQSTQNQSQPEEQSLVGKATDWLTGGQSAGQIAEQAGRGLVNIPFDVLQGGASLINAISQGLGGPKVLDDVIALSIDLQTLTRKPVKQLVGISCQLAQRQKLLERQQSSLEISVPQET